MDRLTTQLDDRRGPVVENECESQLFGIIPTGILGIVLKQVGTALIEIDLLDDHLLAVAVQIDQEDGRGRCDRILQLVPTAGGR